MHTFAGMVHIEDTTWNICQIPSSWDVMSILRLFCLRDFLYNIIESFFKWNYKDIPILFATNSFLPIENLFPNVLFFKFLHSGTLDTWLYLLFSFQSFPLFHPSGIFFLGFLLLFRITSQYLWLWIQNTWLISTLPKIFPVRFHRVFRQPQENSRDFVEEFPITFTVCQL